MGGSDSELIVASVALLISVVALTATFMQVLQQYYASASGYSQCSEEVMGGWAKSKSRRFSWHELRFVVQFDAPVIFVSPPSNEKGPIRDEPILFLDGTPESRSDTDTGEGRDETAPRPARSRTGFPPGVLPPRVDQVNATGAEERIHTANHERASWLVLLYAVQRMEAESCKWQQKQYANRGPPRPASDQYELPPALPSLQDCHTLTVALQRRRKSWDTMPAAVSRPYATTTMCHLVETMAALGVYWKEFDRSREKYRAEGNGFMVLGERVANLGLMFSFQIYGQCSFERSRVVPVDDVKELCFGFVPTIYRAWSDSRRLAAPSGELRDLGSLQMATKGEIAETLVVIGCNKNSVQYFLDENGKTAHLFPMSFEIVGMLARTLHIDNSYFTYLPNPTPDRWDERWLSVVKIMESYRTLSQVEAMQNAAIRHRLAHHMDDILSRHGDDGVGRLLFLKALRAALADADEILTAKRRQPGADDTADMEETPLQRRRREVVRDVLRSHIQEVLRLLNERDDRGLDTLSPQLTVVRPVSPAALGPTDRPTNSPSFEEINEASPDDRQHKFMQVYFGVVRPLVVRHAQESTKRRAGSAPPGYRHRRASVPSAPPGYGEGDQGVEADGAPRNRHGDAEHVGEKRPSLASEHATHDDIWCVLVFRMICWLMLHDFNREDIQVSKSELLGSRMPVYIA